MDLDIMQALELPGPTAGGKMEITMRSPIIKMKKIRIAKTVRREIRIVKVVGSQMSKMKSMD